MIFYNFRSLEHSLQVTDSAFILIFCFFCRMIFKVLTQIPMRSCFFYRFDQFFSFHQLTVFNLGFNFFNVAFR
mgnify:CR=1 FL=1